MNKHSISTPIHSDMERLRAMSDDEIDLSEIPEVTEKQMARAVLRIAGKTIERKKVRINMYLDADVIAFYKAQSGGRGYQTLINDALRSNIHHQEIETTLRRVIREELSHIV